MRKPRLLFVGQLPPPIHGVTVLNERLMASPHMHSRFEIEQFVLSFSSTMSDMARGVTVGKLVRLFGFYYSFVKVCFRFHPEIMYFTMVPRGAGFLRDVYFLLVAKLFRIPAVLHLHGYGVAAAVQHRPILKPVYRWAFRNADVILLSDLLKEDVAGFVPEERIHVVPNGVPDPGCDRPCQVGARATGPVRVLYLSNMMRAKGPLVLVEALRLLSERHVPFEAFFAGAWSEDSVKREFQTMLEQPGLRGRVHFLGPRYGEEKNALFQQADIFVHPTLFEGFPLVILEAMAHGLPVVSTNEGAIPGMIEHGRSGLIVPKGDAPSMADALQTLIEDPSLRLNLGAAARRRYEELYRIETFETRVAEVLASCAAPAPRVGSMTAL